MEGRNIFFETSESFIFTDRLLFFKFSQKDQKVLVINHKFITTKKTQTFHDLGSVQVWDNTALVSGNNSL